MTRIAVAGALGRMGRAILIAASKDKNLKITGALETSSCPDLGKDIGALLGLGNSGLLLSADLSSVLKNSDVLIDFTHPTVTLSFLKAAVEHRKGLVIGTTGLNAEMLSEIKKASQVIPVVQSPNMSVGVNLLFKLTELTGKILDASYDVEVSEIHHRMKKDSPSGTAVKLLEILAKARGRDLDKDVVYGREGEVGARSAGQIGVSALRGGDVVGDHTVFFFGDGERIELTHKASSRDALALGALKAAKYVASGSKGFYTMQDVLGI